MRRIFFGIASVLLLPWLAIASESASKPDPAEANASPQSTDFCQHSAVLNRAAQRLYDAKRFEEALSMAGQVQLDSKCEVEFILACLLRSRVLVFELKEYEKGLLVAGEGLAIEPRHWTLSFIQGQAHFHLEHYRDAIDSFQDVLRYSKSPVPDETLIEARYRTAESFEGLAAKAALAEPGGAQGARNEAASSWMEFHDFCLDVTCPRDLLEHAAKRYEELHSTASSATPSVP